MLKSPNQSCRFETQTGKPVDHGFVAKPRNQCSTSPCEWYRPYTVSPGLPIVRPLSTRPMLDHLRSSAPGLLLLPRSLSLPAMSHLSPTHHETSKRDSSHKINSSRTTEMSRIRIQTSACQWLITYQIKILTTWFLKMQAIQTSSRSSDDSNRPSSVPWIPKSSGFSCCRNYFCAFFEAFRHASQATGIGTSAGGAAPPVKKTRGPSLKSILTPR
jgi:hypothetical protein